MMTHEQVEAVNNLAAHFHKTGDTEGATLLKKLEETCWLAARTSEQFEKMVVWAADCQAATAEGYAGRKSASKSEKRRHGSICQSLLQMIRSGVYTGRVDHQPFDATKQRVTERLQHAVERLGDGSGTDNQGMRRS